MREASVNVRALVEFSCLSGDLVPAGRALRRMREGAQAHVAMQQAYPENWRSEVAVSRTEDVNGLKLTVQGRIDGLGADELGPVIEEIKSTEGELPQDFAGVEVHWMQAIVYAAIVAHREGAASACVRLVYVRGGDTVRLIRRMAAEQLEQTFFHLAQAYAAFQIQQLDARDRARDSAQSLAFPFDGYRAGQRRLVKHAYFALTNDRRLIAQAPTGIGKTMAALYPAVRALGAGAVERIFYLTARTTQRQAAEDALARLRKNGLHLRGVTITAKEKICFAPGAVCSGDACPHARGYFDRIGAAVADGLNQEDLSRAGVEALAKKHGVCPFELSLDLAEQAEAVICDYNYAFDPNVRLRRFFDGRSNRGAMLIDEAHNLPDRVCDMLSAALDTSQVRTARRLCGKHLGRRSAAYRALTELMRALAAEGEGDGAAGESTARESAATGADDSGKQPVCPAKSEGETFPDESAMPAEAAHKSGALAPDGAPLGGCGGDAPALRDGTSSREGAAANVDAAAARREASTACTAAGHSEMAAIEEAASMPGGEPDSAATAEEKPRPQPFCAANAGDALREAVARAVEALRELQPFPEAEVTDLFFALLDFDRVARQAAPEHTCALVEPRRGGCRVKLWRFDPSAHIRDTLKKARGALLFSATLTPLAWYARRCGLDLESGDAALSVPGPFPPENRLVLRAPVPMRYADRERSLPQLVAYLHAMTSAHVGNYMACCPSHALLSRVADAFEAACPEVNVLRQRAGMSEEERAQLLEALQPNPHKTTLAFVAMGGVFAEGVDLPGDRLSGAAILSVGVPQISFERDVLASMEPPAGGYDTAYVYPSVARVAQAAGRVIRTETDRGVILLLDDRFGRRPYSALYAELWQAQPVRNESDAGRRMQAFWERENG